MLADVGVRANRIMMTIASKMVKSFIEVLLWLLVVVDSEDIVSSSCYARSVLLFCSSQVARIKKGGD